MRTAAVVAHPDDESLWLSSVVADCDLVVFCFGDLFDRPRKSAARRRAVAALPLTGVIDLALPESGVGHAVDWAEPQTTAFGMSIADPAARIRYEANYDRLLTALRPALTGCDRVYTHNPWGEYGHADHVQVYRAIMTLQNELGYTVWFTNYVGTASWRLAQTNADTPLWTARSTVRPDQATAQALKRVYRRHGAWTWTWAHRWPVQETLYAQPPGDDQQVRHTLRGEWLLDVAGLRWWPPTWRDSRRQLTGCDSVIMSRP